MNIVIVIRSNVMAYARYFKRINESWILKYFRMDETDVLVLDNPQKYILDKGGNVFIALQNNKPVGTSALLVRDCITCEMAKLAVNSDEQGKGIGYMLGLALIEKARERGFSRIVLEGNLKMEASIALSHKLGFVEVPFEVNVNNIVIHRRCNIFMELILHPTFKPEYYI